MIVVAKDDVGVVTEREAAWGRQEGGDELLFRDRNGDDGRMGVNFVGSPNLVGLNIRSRIQQY